MSAAPSLLELQQAFAQSALGDSGAVSWITSWIVDRGLPAENRMQIYRNALFHNLTETLKTSYPAVHALVGKDFFEGAAARYILAYPSSSGNLQDYGAAFAQWLSQMPEAECVPYVADVARLEWARQQAYLAPDGRGAGEDQGWPAGGKPSSRLALHPSVHLVESVYPVFDLWRYCQEPDGEPPALAVGEQHVLVWRADNQIALQVIDALETRLARRALECGSLAQAVSEVAESCDVTVCIERWSTQGLMDGREARTAENLSVILGHP